MTQERDEVWEIHLNRLHFGKLRIWTCFQIVIYTRRRDKAAALQPPQAEHWKCDKTQTYNIQILDRDRYSNSRKRKTDLKRRPRCDIPTNSWVNAKDKHGGTLTTVPIVECEEKPIFSPSYKLTAPGRGPDHRSSSQHTREPPKLPGLSRGKDFHQAIEVQPHNQLPRHGPLGATPQH